MTFQRVCGTFSFIILLVVVLLSISSPVAQDQARHITQTWNIISILAECLYFASCAVVFVGMMGKNFISDNPLANKIAICSWVFFFIVLLILSAYTPASGIVAPAIVSLLFGYALFAFPFIIAIDWFLKPEPSDLD